MKKTTLEKLKEFMQGEGWFTLRAIASELLVSEQTASARVRDLRKASFGGHTVNRREVAGEKYFHYQLIENKI